MPVVHVRKQPYQVYIGRAGRGQDGYFGNPYVVGTNGFSRGETISWFREYAQDRMYRDPEYRARVKALHGKVLGCFCAPAPCHGDVLLDLAAREIMIEER